MTQLEKLEIAHFLRFLKKKHILGDFMQEYYKQKGNVDLAKGQQILSAFSWSKSKQGSKFWISISHQWTIEYQNFVSSQQN